MTNMSLLIRKTKKCCAKLFRKIQQSTSATSGQETEHRHARDSSNKKCNYNNNNNRNNHVTQSNHHQNNNRSSKNEKLSKNNNGSVKRTNVPGRVHQSAKHQHRRSHFNPASDSFIYEHCTDAHSTSTVDDDSANGISSSGSSDADDEDDISKSVYPSTRHNIKKRFQSVQQAANLNNNYTELRSTRQCHNTTMSSTSGSTLEPRTRISRRLHAMASSRFAQEDIVFTENQIYIGLKEMMNAQNSTATNRGQKLMDKRPFNVVSNMDTQNQQATKNYAKSFHDGGFCEKIIFEKVKYDKNKRYLQTSPVSTASTSSRGRVAPESDALNYHAFLNDQTSQTRTSSMYIEDEHNSTFTQNWPPSRAHPTSHWITSRRLRNEVGQTNDSMLNDNPTDAWQSLYDNDTGYVEQNSILDNHRNRIRSSTPSPPDTMMTNTNNNSYYYERASASYSRRSSISTTETWVDDESFDNSFNEELEKRCEVFCR